MFQDHTLWPRLTVGGDTELKRIHDETGATVVFVTHDQMEAMTMATHIAVMSEGELRQVASPMEMYERPGNRFVAEMFAVTTHGDPGAGAGDGLRCWARPGRLHLFAANGSRTGAWDDAAAPVQKAAS